MRKQQELPERAWLWMDDIAGGLWSADRPSERSALFQFKEYRRVDTAVLERVKQEAAEKERERLENWALSKHREYMESKGRNPADYASQWSFMADAIREKLDDPR